MLPISELRGAVPYMMLRCGLPWYAALAYCAFFNALAGPIALAFLSSVHGLLYRVSWYRSLFDRFVERKRGKVQAAVDRYGWIGLMAFVAIPFPLTGAWTGALGGWLLGIKTRRILLATTAGVAIAGIIVTAVVQFGIGAFGFLLGNY
jgi:uncharacterized membrane protein